MRTGTFCLALVALIAHASGARADSSKGEGGGDAPAAVVEPASATVPAQAAPPSTPPAPPPAPARLPGPLGAPDIEVHGRVFVGATADERVSWRRDMGLRSARLGIDATLPNVEVSIEADLADTSIVKDAFARLHDDSDRFALRAGRFKAPFSARRLESSWKLPLLARGIVDAFVVDQSGLGGRRLGVEGEVTLHGPVRFEASAGVFRGDVAYAGDPAPEDLAARAEVRPWKALRLGATAYRSRPETGPMRWAATAYARVRALGGELTAEGSSGDVAIGSFRAATLLAERAFALGGSPWSVSPLVGGEVLRVGGAAADEGWSALCGAVLARDDALKVKVIAERALRPGEGRAGSTVGVELGTRF